MTNNRLIAALTRNSERRLGLSLVLFFLVLSAMTSWLAYRAYSQAQWELFHRYRIQAQALSIEIDNQLAAAIAEEDARAFADFSFYGVGGAGSTARAARSPLAALTPPSSLPGVVGYFQVDSAGNLTTPLLPSPSAHVEQQIDAAELAVRTERASALARILAVAPSAAAVREDGLSKADRVTPTAAAAGKAANIASGDLFDRLTVGDAKPQTAESNYGRVADLNLGQRLEKKSRAVAKQSAAPRSQPLFKRESRKEQVAIYQSADAASEVAEIDQAADLARQVMAPSAAPALRASDVEREQSAGSQLRGYLPPAPRRAELTRSVPTKPSIGAADSVRERRVSLFESEIDPMSIRRLGNQHIVVFRNVWRDGERFVQGLVLEQSALVDGMIRRLWAASELAVMSHLLIAWAGDVVALETRHNAPAASDVGSLRGELLYQTRLSAPLSALELVYSVVELPLGSSAGFLLWVTVAMLTVLVAGCLAMYRFGCGQLRLYRQQQDFVSAVSHELKTPLTSIRMYAEMLKAGWADEQRKATYYSYIHDESERLSRLINNVLQLARITRSQTELELKPISCAELLSMAKSRLHSQADPAGFQINYDIDDAAAAARVMVDDDVVMQIVINFVDNAIKFTPQAGRKEIELGCRLEHETVRISVRDFGHGVAPDQMRRIFELFYRAENELTRDTVGTGIGLALVRQLAAAMGASADVRNRDPGAEFTLVIPVLERQQHA